MIWMEIALYVASFAISYFLQPKPKSAKPSLLSDFNLPTAEVGRPIPVLFGTRDIKSPNITWYGDLRTKAIKK